MIGPTLPPGVQRNSTPSEEGSDDDYGPALPPGFQKPTAGPSRPPPVAEPAPTASADAALSDSDDDDIGPLPAAPGASGNAPADDGVRAFLEREQRQREKDANGNPEKLERAEWMMKPPKESDLLSSMDPTKLRSRGFNSAADSKRKEAARKDQSLWTETPAERAQRIADEQSGKKRRIENAEDLLTPEEQEAQRRKKKRDQAISKDLEGYHGQSESLLDKHAKKQKSKKGEDDDGKPPAIWDRESMLGAGAAISNQKRSEMIKSAKGPSGLSSRFGSSGYS